MPVEGGREEQGYYLPVLFQPQVGMSLSLRSFFFIVQWSLEGSKKIHQGSEGFGAFYSSL